MTADSFTRNLFEWLAQVNADRKLKSSDFRVAYVVSSYVSRVHGLAWPSQETISRAAGFSKRNVQKCLANLVGGGHLTITSGRGRKVVSEYRITNKANAGSPLFDRTDAEKVNAGSPLFDRTDAEKANQRSRKGEPVFAKRRTAVRTELSEELSEELSDKNRAPERDIGVDEFEGWFQLFPGPKDDSKGEAFAAWSKLQDRPPQEHLIEAARLYGEELDRMNTGREARFRKQPLRAAKFLSDRVFENFRVPVAIAINKRAAGDEAFDKTIAAWGDAAAPVIEAIGRPLFRARFLGSTGRVEDGALIITMTGSYTATAAQCDLGPKLSARLGMPVQIKSPDQQARSAA